MPPYRDTHTDLRCPRCGDGLDAVREGLAACLNCHGLWLGSAALVVAFGTRAWPAGANAWWKRELVCPECNGEMDAIIASEVVVDRCARHGVWLDPGELGRLLGAPQAEELAAFYRHIAPDQTLPELTARQKIREKQREQLWREAEDKLRANHAEATVERQRQRRAELRAELAAAEASLAAAKRKTRLS